MCTHKTGYFEMLHMFMEALQSEALQIFISVKITITQKCYIARQSRLFQLPGVSKKYSMY